MSSKTFPRADKKLDSNSSFTLCSQRIKCQKNTIMSKNKYSKQNLQKNKNLFNIAQNLRYSDLYDGMIILGCIFKVTDYYAIVSLPGLISGKLKAIDICESYTDLLKNIADNEEISDKFKTLSNLYEEGDYIICYIKKVNFQSKEIILSTEPNLINEKLNPSLLTKYSTLVLNVKSVEDHGYILETGLNNVRAFLPKKDMENIKIKLHIGKQILCSVKDIQKSDHIFTLAVSLKSKHVKCLESSMLPFNDFIPGRLFSLVVEKVLKDGLQVTFGENSIGYINQFHIEKALSHFEQGQKLVGTLLYVIPTTKLAYFSLLPQDKPNKSIAIGDIVPQAQTLAHDSRGILIQLKKGIRGFIPLKRTEVDFGKLESIFTLNSIHKCKVIAYDSIAQLYICSMQQNALSKQYYDLNDLQTGNIVKVKITDIDKNNGCITVSFGKLSGKVPPDQVVDVESENNLNIGDFVEARVLDLSQQIIFTLKKSLVESKLPILSRIENATVDEEYDGSVIKISNEGVLVRFFDNVKGWIPKRFLSSREVFDNWNLALGQTITVVVKEINIDKNKITLSLVSNDKDPNNYLKIGDIFEGYVTDSSIEGVHLRIESYNNFNALAYLPAGHICPCLEVGKLLAAKMVAGDKLSVIIFSVTPQLIVSTSLVPEKIYSNISDLNCGDIILCSVMKICKESIKVLLPVKNYPKYGYISINNVENIEAIFENQLLFAKVTQTFNENQEISLTSRLSAIWKDTAKPEVQMMSAVDVLSLYLNKILELSKNIVYISKPLSKVKIGQQMKGIVESIFSDVLVLKMEGNIKGILRKASCSKFYNRGEEVEATVLWIDYLHDYVELSLLSTVTKNVSIKQNKLAKIPIGVQLRGEIVLVTNWFVLVALKGQIKGTLVSLPARRHLNDIAPDLTPYKIGCKVRCYGVLNKSDASILLPICLLKSAFEKQNFLSNKVEPLLVSRKRKAQESEIHKEFLRLKKVKKSDNNVNVQNETFKTINEQNYTIKVEWENSNKKKVLTVLHNDYPKKKEARTDKKQEKYEEVVCNYEENDNVIKQMKMSFRNKNQKCESKSLENKTLLLNLSISECGFNWNNLTIKNETHRSNASETEVDQLSKKEKILSLADKQNLERNKEKHLREKEEALAKRETPQTVDQFDRLVLANPDCSLAWAQYMVYYLQLTDVQKARTIARRALKTINFREENERLNIWNAWLNLESKFGSLESLDTIFQEAFKTSNAEKVCAHMLTLHLASERYTEIEKLINIMVVKFKQNPYTWVNCGAMFLKIGLKNKARQLMQRALQSLPVCKHVDLIVRFAVLENKFGDKERSQSLFESILDRYRNRIDVWLSYVDMLIKSDDIEIARKVLKRAITKVLPIKKAKVLFKKFINFERKYGSESSVLYIQQLAAKYVEEQCDEIINKQG